MSFLCSSAGKESTCNVGDLGSTPGWGRSPGEGNSHPLQYSGLENSMDCIIHGFAKSKKRHLQGPDVCAKSLQWLATLCDPMDCSPPGSCVDGILQAGILEWFPISFSRGSSPPRD